jgi:predicted RNA-binding protein with PIN domain
MRWLIDGYNVMHAGGRIASALKREGFRRARRRFLDELADAVGPEAAHETTVIFDASVPPVDFRVVETYRSIQIRFALGDENADARIESLISEHSSPKALTVVSSDRRIRSAAARRRARILTAEEFWDLIDDLKERRAGKRRDDTSGALARSSRKDRPAPPDEPAFWLETFREVAEDPGIQQALARDDSLLTDAEIAELERQIERES